MVWSIMVVTISKKLICSHRSLHSPEWCCLIHLMLDLPPFIDHMLRSLCSFLTIDSCHFLPIGFFIPFLAFEDLYICDFFIHRYIKQWETYFLHVFFVHFHFILFFFYICNFFQDEKIFDEETRKKEVAANLSLIYRIIRVEKKLDLTQIHFHAKVARND